VPGTTRPALTHPWLAPGTLGSLGGSEAEPSSASLAGGHQHHWLIQEQGTARSSGICDCGAERLFSNGWSDDRDSQHGWSGQKPRTTR
jgi:hypothetical protein